MLCNYLNFADSHGLRFSFGNVPPEGAGSSKFEPLASNGLDGENILALAQGSLLIRSQALTAPRFSATSHLRS